MKTLHKNTNLSTGKITVTEKTKVIFYYEKDSKEVFAFFPDEKYNREPGLFTCYAHIGQHSACSTEYTKECRLVNRADYLDLERELESLGYDLVVCNDYVVEYHRNPTPGEIKFGEGATHYKAFHFDQCYKWHPNQLTFKKWLKDPADGLRYYR